MKATFITTSWLGVLTPALMVVSAFNTPTDLHEKHHVRTDHDDQLKKEALEILNAKCNGCHRDQNPLMVFKEKNMSRRARKIYRTVFVEKRMPKGNEIRLTRAEYNQLEKWLKTQKID